MSTVKIKRSGTASSTPSSLDHGELALNYADDTLFWKDSANVIKSFVFQAYAPAASPAITGNATFSASSGVPVTITNTGTGNSFVVNDASGDTTPFVVDADGRVGIGILAPNNRLSVVGQFSAGNVERIANNAGAGGFYDRLEIGGGTQATRSYGSLWIYNSSNSQTHQFHSYPGTDNYINNGGKLGVNKSNPASALDVNGVITVSATSGSAGSYAPSLTFSGDSNTGFGQVSGQSDSASIFTAGHERLRVDASGRVGIGVTPTAPLHVKSSSGETLRLESTASGNGYVQFVNTSGSMSFGMTGSASNRVLLYDRTNNQSAYDYLGGASGVHRFFTNDTHRMSVKSTGAVRFVPLSADPASGEAGDVYYNSSTNKLRVYNGTSWIDLH